jgi:hypothetical protein
MILSMHRSRVVACLLAALFICSPAESKVFLEEGKVKLSVSPGENIAGELKLHNTSNQTIEMRVYWEDFIYTPPYDGSKEFLTKGTTDHSIADWVNVSNETLTFAPFASRSVPYMINVAGDIRQGHQGVLFFEQEEIKAQGSKGLNVLTRVGCLFFIEPKSKVKKAEIKNFRFFDNELTAEFTNQGNVILIPDGTYYVINDDGMVYDRGQMKKIYLPPDKTADYPIVFNQDLDPGTYTLVMTVDLDEGDVLVKEIDFKKIYPSGFNIIEIRD